MSPTLFHFTVLHDNDLIGVTNCAEAMSDHYDCLFA